MTRRPSYAYLPGLLALGLLSLPALAAGMQTASPRSADPHAADPLATTSQLHRQVSRSKDRVAQLQQGVAQQESRSRQAAARLQQQDDTIAELKKQLQALRSARKASPAGQ